MAREAQIKKRKEIFLEALEKSMGIIVHACRASGIPRRTVYNWKKSDEEFRKRMEDIEEDAIDIAESKLFKKVMEGDLTAIIYYLKKKGRKRGWGDELHITSGDALNEIVIKGLERGED